MSLFDLLIKHMSSAYRSKVRDAVLTRPRRLLMNTLNNIELSLDHCASPFSTYLGSDCVWFKTTFI